MIGRSLENRKRAASRHGPGRDKIGWRRDEHLVAHQTCPEPRDRFREIVLDRGRQSRRVEGLEGGQGAPHQADPVVDGLGPPGVAKVEDGFDRAPWE